MSFIVVILLLSIGFGNTNGVILWSNVRGFLFTSSYSILLLSLAFMI